jgi:hypothetical protein
MLLISNMAVKTCSNVSRIRHRATNPARLPQSTFSIGRGKRRAKETRVANAQMNCGEKCRRAPTAAHSASLPLA